MESTDFERAGLEYELTLIIQHPVTSIRRVKRLVWISLKEIFFILSAKKTNIGKESNTP